MLARDIFSRRVLGDSKNALAASGRQPAAAACGLPVVAEKSCAKNFEGTSFTLEIPFSSV